MWHTVEGVPPRAHVAGGRVTGDCARLGAWSLPLCVWAINKPRPLFLPLPPHQMALVTVAIPLGTFWNQMLRTRVPTSLYLRPVCPGLRGFPEHRPFSFKTKMVPGKLGCVGHPIMSSEEMWGAQGGSNCPEMPESGRALAGGAPVPPVMLHVHPGYKPLLSPAAASTPAELQHGGWRWGERAAPSPRSR